MIKLILPLLASALLSCGRQNGSYTAESTAVPDHDQSSMEQPVMKFDTLVHDFGTIIEGERVVCYFDYMNDGEAELLITSVEATCGCTTPGWSREPLGPGEEGSMEIVFDASGRSGAQRKIVTVKSNASEQMISLIIRANVKKSV